MRNPGIQIQDLLLSSKAGQNWVSGRRPAATCSAVTHLYHQILDRRYYWN